MFKQLLSTFQHRPALYETTGIPFWDDEHISHSMLQAHLNPQEDGASRKHDFILRSAKWIAQLAGPAGKKLLDLGCGPGLYAERFCDLGFSVTGVDLSRRSIAYAKESAAKSRRDISYACQDYLTLDYAREFDLAVLIYCDYGVLPPDDRRSLLQKISLALRPGGLFILDAFTPQKYADFGEGLSAQYHQTGFWQQDAHLSIRRDAVYPDHTYLEQYVIIGEESCHTYNLWNRAFTSDTLSGELGEAGFETTAIFGDAAGSPYTQESDVICAVCKKV